MPATDPLTLRGGRAPRRARRGSCRLLAVAFLGLLAPLAARAFPPAPYHLVYGTARNEFGQLLEGKDVKVVLESATGRYLQSGVGAVGTSLGGANFAIRVPMDTGVFDTPYHPTALRPAAPFRLKVIIGNKVLLPIEMQGDARSLGAPGGRTRMDLTLGEDSDGDGIPDAWERIMMGSLGLANLADFRPDDDSDGDGLSNRDEYLSGTYALDPADGFRLEIVEMQSEGPVMEFLALRGRTYSVESSPDLARWVPQSFRVAGTTEDLTRFRATDTRVIRILGLTGEAAGGFFKLRVE